MSQIEMSKEYKTRDGRSVRLLCTDGPSESPVVAIVYGAGFPGRVITYSSDGKVKGASHLDLIEVRKKFRREAWVNVYPEDDKTGDCIHSSKLRADEAATLGRRIACIKVIIEGEEGEGL